MKTVGTMHFNHNVFTLKLGIKTTKCSAPGAPTSHILWVAVFAVRSQQSGLFFFLFSFSSIHLYIISQLKEVIIKLNYS